MEGQDDFLGHEPHDYATLAREWTELAAREGWDCRVFAEVDGYELISVRNGSGGGIYLSAGIHGDEAAAAWGLLEWGRRQAGQLGTRDFHLFPCLNPWGLESNRRSNASGQDLNRLFHDESLPLMKAWRSELGEERFSCAICLHEDYDAKGIYLYELARGSRQGEELLAECEEVLKRQPDGMVEELESRNGIMIVPEDLDSLLEEMSEQLPESIYLYQNHTDWTLTFETPSETGWRKRVEAHGRFVSAVLRRSPIEAAGSASKS